MAPPDLAHASGNPAGYGRSCTNCSKAKCKCILQADQQVCERCHRLGKLCQPMASARKKSTKRPTASKTAQLEEKLDDLVSILRAARSQPSELSESQNYSQPYGSSPYPQPRPEVNLQPEAHFQSGQRTSQHRSPSSFPSQEGFLSRLDSLATAATSSKAQSQPQNYMALGSHPGDSQNGHPTNASAHTLRETDHRPEPTPEEAEAYLEKFRGWIAYFPFLQLPLNQNGEDLRRDSPFLWLCIMNVTSMSVPQVTMLKDRVREELARRIVVENERSLDLLQGIIVYLAWATINSGPGVRPFIIMYAQLAITVLYDLGMTRSPIEEQYVTASFKVWGGRPPHTKTRTMAERRSILALWFMTSISTAFIGKMDTLRWTPHMDECLQVLERSAEFPSDEVLVTLVKVQRIADEAQKLLVRDVMGEAGAAPTHVFKKGMIHRLQTAREGISHSAWSNYMIQAHSAATEIAIQSVGLFTRDVIDPNRIESMYACLKAVKSWYEVFFSIPLSEMAGIPFMLYVELSQSQVALYRLTTIEDTAWDKELVRNTANLLVLLDHTIERFLGAGEAYPFRAVPDEETIFAKGARVMRGIKNLWEPAVTPYLGNLPTPSSQAMSGNSLNSLNNNNGGSNSNSNSNSGGHAVDLTAEMVDNNVMIEQAGVDFGDWAWMSDVFGPWEF